jgi:hypothetical protein
MNIVTVDFETFYDQNFSLSKMTTEAYIRSDLFEVIGVSVKVNGLPGDWYSGNDTRGFLHSMDWSDKAVLCHHTAFDGAIMSWLYGIKPKLWLDTMSMSRPFHAVTVGASLKALGLYYGIGKKGEEVIVAKGMRRKDFTSAQLKKYGDYCINDGQLTWDLFRKLQPMVPASELLIIDKMLRMYTEPVFELDRFSLAEHLLDEKAKKEQMLSTLGGGEIARKLLMSNDKFAKLLVALNVTPPMKISLTTGKETYAFAKTDQGFKDLLDHPDPAVVAVVEARLGVKSTIEETRTQRLIEVAERGALPIMLKYYAAHTGRFGGGDKLNLQNLPARKQKVIRQSIQAPEGKKVITCDSAQIEARVLSLVAEQWDLNDAFRQGRDVYSEFASLVYGRKVDRKANPGDKVPGFVGKTCILGLGYGMGPPKFIDTCKMQGDVVFDLKEGMRIVYLYRERYQKIPMLWKAGDQLLADMLAGRDGVIGGFISYTPAGIELPNGLRLTYHALEPIKGPAGKQNYRYISDALVYRKWVARKITKIDVEELAWTYIYGGKVIENIVQALARIVVADQMVAIAKEFPVALQVHDENVCVVDDADVSRAEHVMMREMSKPPTWAPTLPIACEIGVGDNFGDAK